MSPSDQISGAKTEVAAEFSEEKCASVDRLRSHWHIRWILWGKAATVTRNLK